MTPVIFLDWDGVLVFGAEGWSADAMAQLNLLCLETGAAIVLTTSCRYEMPLKKLVATMRRNGLDKKVPVLGETRDLDAYRNALSKNDFEFLVGFERWSKGREIRAWLEDHPEVERFVVIDDHPELCTPYEEQTVVPVGPFSVADRALAATLLS
ncbi:MAG: hypothetical protein EOP84_28785 [Verrucomicrobiaceae bacterium]|nr:MAG: hypothetical protein EOP84_28785 [Verrucomicrobiaceae bacterium]